MTEHLLLIDDEPDFLSGVRRLLEREFNGLSVATADRPRTALAMVRRRQYDLILLDIKMPEMDGLDLLEELLRLDPALSVVMLTAHGTIDTAVTAMKKGAWDFLTKPVDRETLCRVVSRGLERNRLKRENERLRRELSDRHRFVGNSPALRRFLDELRNAAATDYNVLVRGASGTGKELAARAIHAWSARSKGPLVMVNCPAIPEHLLESELFGHCRGAFTGADREHRGLFAAADTGTLVLDEIGDIPLAIQAKLLRVLEEQEIRPLGASKPIPVDVRIVAVTNRDLEAMIAEGRFRQDLFYRLNVLGVETPGLAAMREDIPELAEHFLRQAARETGRPMPPLTKELLRALMERPWPGNVRELQNAMRRLVVTGDLRLPATGPAALSAEEDLPYGEAKERLLEHFNRRYFHRLLQRTSGNVSRAAVVAGLNRSALQKILRRLDIDPAAYRA